MKGYYVSYMCIYTTYVKADSPEEAAKIAQGRCEYDTDGLAWVTDCDTGEEYEV